MLGDHGRPLTVLPQLADLVLDVMLELSRLLVLGDFNIHAKTVRDKLANKFLATMITLGTSQVISGPTHHVGGLKAYWE